MTKREILLSIAAPLAAWALEYQSPVHHDGDELATIGALTITVGMLRSVLRWYTGTADARERSECIVEREQVAA